MNEILQQFSVLWQDIFSHPVGSLAIIGNLIVIESLLSVDNAAVLATMVMDLKPEDRSKALKYGIWGAYIFRGIAMLSAAVLIKIWWLKPIGGLYLLYLVFDWWKGKQTETNDDDLIDKNTNWFYRVTVGSIGNFWATVILVEIMDVAFSIDNVFAAVAFTPNILLVCIGVFIGIFAMRFVAQWFVQLMEKYRFLETSAFMVIGILGLKLCVSVLHHFAPANSTAQFLESEAADILVSILTVLVFFIPIISSLLFNYPKHQK